MLGANRADAHHFILFLLKSVSYKNLGINGGSLLA
jgi:hypothetical protein